MAIFEVSNPRRTDAIAYIVPLSCDSQDAFLLRTNKKRLACDSTQGQPMAQVDYATFACRRAITFGSSRSNDFQLPAAWDVGEQHFKLHLNLESSELSITDSSDAGIWIIDHTQKTHTHLCNDTRPLLRDTRISFGHNSRYQFCISVDDYMANLSGFSDLFAEYLQSINHTPCKSAHESQVRREDSAVCKSPVITLHTAEEYVRQGNDDDDDQSETTTLKSSPSKDKTLHVSFDEVDPSRSLKRKRSETEFGYKKSSCEGCADRQTKRTRPSCRVM